nr:hypothetical protein [Streptomyces griseorubens]
MRPGAGRNQSGQFGFVEVETEQPIARTIAEWLSRPVPEEPAEPAGSVTTAR